MSYSSLGWFAYEPGYTDYPDIEDGTDYERFRQTNWNQGDIYLFRFQCAPPSSLNDRWLKSWTATWPLVQAFVYSMPSGSRGTDIVAITVKPVGSGNSSQVEILFKDAGYSHVNGDASGTTLKKMGDFLSVYSGGLNYKLSDPAYAMLAESIGAKIATSRWLGSPVIWSYDKFEKSGRGWDLGWKEGFTKYASDGGGHWLGSALNTSRAIAGVPKPAVLPPDPSIPSEPGPSEPAPSEPGQALPYPGDQYPGESELQYEETDVVPWLIGGIAVATGAAFWFLRKKSD